MDEGSGVPPTDLPGLALLLVQLGFHAGREFGERLAPLGLEQRQAGMLVPLAANEGNAQALPGMPPGRRAGSRAAAGTQGGVPGRAD